MTGERIGATVASMTRHGGDVLDFETLVAAHQRRVYLLAFDLTGNHHDAEDLAQQTFLKALQGLGRFRGESSVVTWLRRIAVNTHIDRMRRRDTSARTSIPVGDIDGDPVASLPALRAGDDPEQTTAAATIQRHIRQALASLSPQERTVFVLRHYHQLKLREIAAVLDVTAGTVKSSLFRAVRRLRDELAFYRPELGVEETR